MVVMSESPCSRYCAVACHVSILSWRPSVIWPTAFRDNFRVTRGSFSCWVIFGVLFLVYESIFFGYGQRTMSHVL